jgi:tight adherence protein C
MAQLLASLAAVGAVLAAASRRRESVARRRLRALAPARATDQWSVVATVTSVTATVGRLVRRVIGRPSEPASDRKVGEVVLLVTAGSIVHPLVGVTAAVLLVAWRVHARRRATRRAAEHLLDDLPDVVDLFRVAAGGGLTVHHAVAAVAAVADGPIGSALAEVQRRVSIGERLVDALPLLSHLGDPARPLASALISAERDGSPLSRPLERVADEARDVRRRRAEERAHRVPVRLLFPLVLCVLPAFALVTVVPLLAGTLQTLSP